MKNTIASIVLFATLHLVAQTKFKGMIMDKSLPKGKMGVGGVSVFWEGTAVGATTNEKGWFTIDYKKEYQNLVVSFVGFKTDTITIKNPLKPLHYFLIEDNALDEVTIASTKKKNVIKSFLQTENVFTVNTGELLKAACCNLSESFETNPSIDVNFSDALTGTRQIQMLGLKSPYLLITEENIPSVRGASQVFGLTFTPGTWIESIQITKGSGSVINGFESISGQINTELVKPATDAKFFLNGYANLDGLMELNSHINHKINDKWATGLYFHAHHRVTRFDTNNDGFLDNPLSEHINIMNRWQYSNPNSGWVSFFNVRFLNDKKQTGQLNFSPAIHKNTTNTWQSEIGTKRFDVSTKLGYVFPEMPFQSIGLQLAYTNHDQDSYFGLRSYDIKQQSVYSNLIFNSIINNTQHKFKTGINFNYDRYDEFVSQTDYSRDERSVGGFFEYAFDNDENISLTAGVRLDHHNLIGTFVTPRLHLRYVPWEKAVLRASAGKGTKTASIFAENQQLFASSRSITIQKDKEGKIYGLKPEKAWNYGVSFLQGFTIFNKKADISIDFYQTNFEDQVVVDWETANNISFYNLQGKSVANSLQTEVNFSPYHHLDFRIAYKFTDVSTAYNLGSRIKPLQSKHRFFINASAQTHKHNNSQWKFDMTYNFNGKQRLPSVNGLDYTDSFGLLNAQVTRVFSDTFEFYLGSENITNYTQKIPILGVENPFGSNFDTTIVYAPVFGMGIYAGFRLKIK